MTATKGDAAREQVQAPVSRAKFGPVELIYGANGGKYPEANFAFVTGKDGVAIIDLPLVARRIPDELARADMALLSHVHEDHVAGLPLVPDTPVHVHDADAAAIRTMKGYAASLGYRPDAERATCELARTQFHFRPRTNVELYSDGAVWDLGGVRVRAIHAPGHTAGHCIFVIDPGAIVFLADIDLSTFGPYYGDATSSLRAFRSTLAMLKQIDSACWITSHHKGVVIGREPFLALLDKFGSAFARRETALIEALRSGPRSLEDLVKQRFVYPQSYSAPYLDDVERRMISQHLDELVEQGRISVEGERYGLATSG